MCYICNVGDVSIHHWERCQGYVDRFITEASRLFTRCRIDDIEQGSGVMDTSYVQFFGDDFLRTLILRFVFCDVALRLHRSFRGRHNRGFRPRCEPPLPTMELLEHPSLGHIVLQLASSLDVRGHFSEGPEMNDWYILTVLIMMIAVLEFLYNNNCNNKHKGYDDNSNKKRALLAELSNLALSIPPKLSAPPNNFKLMMNVFTTLYYHYW